MSAFVPGSSQVNSSDIERNRFSFAKPSMPLFFDYYTGNQRKSKNGAEKTGGIPEHRSLHGYRQSIGHCTDSGRVER
ncbi:hypothetical protein DXA13_11095 [Clostridium sp. AM58-1XD]|nr:hypothetical protein DXA13_11095 [Clostridium sp. AM58-1XD]